MPNYYAHFQFGNQVLELLADGLQKRLAGEGFLLGCLGPDPLFFCRPALPNRIRRIGVETHHAPGMIPLRRLRRGVEEGRKQVPGYAAGFICHLALDSACHPYLEARAREGRATHLAMEAELDRFLMEADGLSPAKSHMPCLGDPFAFQAAALAYPGLAGQQIQKSYQAMARDTALLAATYGRWTGKLLNQTAARFQPLRDIAGIALQKECAPECRGSNQVLLGLMERAIPVAARQIEEFFQAIERGIPLGPWLWRDFGGRTGRWGEKAPCPVTG